jgi:hypothetical protein
VVDQVVEQLSRNRHLQTRHVREIRSTQPARFVHLAEEHFLGRSLRGPPEVHLALQGAELTILESPRVLPLQPAKECLGLQVGGRTQLLFELRPDAGKRVRPSSPIAFRTILIAGEPLHDPVPPCRLPIDAGLLSCLKKADALIHQAEQLPNVHIRDLGHRKLLPEWGLR